MRYKFEIVALLATVLLAIASFVALSLDLGVVLTSVTIAAIFLLETINVIVFGSWFCLAGNTGRASSFAFLLLGLLIAVIAYPLSLREMTGPVIYVITILSALFSLLVIYVAMATYVTESVHYKRSKICQSELIAILKEFVARDNISPTAQIDSLGDFSIEQLNLMKEEIGSRFGVSLLGLSVKKFRKMSVNSMVAYLM